MTAAGGASVCARVCAMFAVDVGNRNEHLISSSQERCCAEGPGRHKLTLPGDFKSNRAATVYAKLTAAVQKQQYNSTSASNSGH